MPKEFWRVYNYVAKNWYDLEYGVTDFEGRWYEPAMLKLETIIRSHATGGRGWV